MNHLLRRVSKNLRYRHLPNLISPKIHLASFELAVPAVSSWLARQVQFPVVFEREETKYRSFSVVKYGLLDLTFSVEQVDWNHNDSPGIPLLRDLGFVMSPENVPEGLIDDPTCLAELEEDIGKDQNLLRLFLEKNPGQLGDPDVLKQIMRSGKLQQILGAMEAGGEDFKRVVDDCFPADFTVSDACLTNAGFVWFHKHFYL